MSFLKNVFKYLFVFLFLGFCCLVVYAAATTLLNAPETSNTAYNVGYYIGAALLGLLGLYPIWRFGKALLKD